MIVLVSDTGGSMDPSTCADRQITVGACNLPNTVMLDSHAITGRNGPRYKIPHDPSMTTASVVDRIAAAFNRVGDSLTMADAINIALEIARRPAPSDLSQAHP